MLFDDQRAHGLVGALGLGLAVVARSTLARADDPAGLLNQAPATTGTTEIAQEGFQAAVVPPEENKDGTTLRLSAGGILTQGNSRTIAATGAADYFLRRGNSQLSAQAAANYGRSAPSADEPMKVSVENYQGRVRYDQFLSGGLAAFFSVSARRDRFQGLNLRLNIDPGAAYYFVDLKSHRMWGELGYDLQVDFRRQEFIDAAAIAAEPQFLKEREVRHNVRAFLGYDNQLTDAVKVALGLEYLQNVEEAKNARINVDAALTSQLSTSFSSAATISVRYDNNPLPGVEETDVVTALNLVYTLNE